MRRGSWQRAQDCAVLDEDDEAKAEDEEDAMVEVMVREEREGGGQRDRAGSVRRTKFSWNAWIASRSLGRSRPAFQPAPVAARPCGSQIAWDFDPYISNPSEKHSLQGRRLTRVRDASRLALHARKSGAPIDPTDAPAHMHPSSKTLCKASSRYGCPVLAFV